jgi:hypothetical protein
VDHIPDLNLTRVIGVHGEGHELLQRHANLGADLKQGKGDGGKFEALLHDLRCHEEGGSNFCIALTLVTQGHKRAELIKRVQGDALHTFRNRVVLGKERGRCIPHAQALQQTATGDAFDQFLDGHANLDAPHVGLAQHQIVERDIPRRRQSAFLDSFRHQIFSTTGAGSHSPDITSRHSQTNTPFPLDDRMVAKMRLNSC